MIRRVACAISGGVDSAVAAFLLKQKGFDVVGVYMMNWDVVDEGTSSCPQIQDEIDARNVCERLSIDFRVVNFSHIYWNEIFTHTLENYRKGRTVVPDVLCNRLIKFDHLYEFAKKALAVDAVATGHYVRTNLGDYLEKSGSSEKVKLLKGRDPIKDQSFFLSTLTESQLRRSMFPVGSLIKSQVRKIAREINLLEVSSKPESMGMCFIGKRKKFDEFIDQYIEPCEGKVRLIDDGSTIWHHKGIHHFTIGKRVPVPFQYSRSHLGTFVTSLDYCSQDVWVCHGTNHPNLYAKEFVISEPCWITDSPFDIEDTPVVYFSVQRTHPPYPCTILRLPNRLIKVRAKNAVRAAAPGQICVFYVGEQCLGSGEIQAVLKTLADID